MKTPLTPCKTCTEKDKSVFCDLKDNHLKEIDRAKTANRYKPHQIIFYEGNNPFGVYCIQSGKIKIYKMDAQGKQQIVRLAGPGDIIGYRCLLSGEAYSATAESIEEAVVCFIDKKTFLDTIEGHPQTAMQIMQRLASDLRRAEDQVANLVHKNVRERLAELLLVFRTKYGKKTDKGIELEISLTREEMAELIGTTQESVIRLISEFKDDALIEVQGRHITLLNINKLATTANIDE